MGYFNSVMGFHESTGSPMLLSCEDFRAGVTLCSLLDRDTHGSFYTWSRNRNGHIISSRLDRAFCNSKFLDSWSQIAAFTLHSTHYDHFPFLVDCNLKSLVGPRPFRFQKMWLFHPTFLDLVKRVWSSRQEGSAMSKLISKLKFLKKELKVWNWTVFGDLNKNIMATEDKLASIQLHFDLEGHSEDLLRQELDATSALGGVCFY